jgi:hypothetical protein
MVARVVEPASLGGQQWGQRKRKARDSGRQRHRQGRLTATNGEIEYRLLYNTKHLDKDYLPCT